MYRLVTFSSLLLFSISFAAKGQVISDSIFEETIRTVQLYPDFGQLNDVVLPAAVPLNQQNLKLEFDELSEDYENFILKIIRCNPDWIVSQVPEIEYLEDYNEFQVVNMQPSFNTKVIFTHYSIAIPKTLLSGNYVAQIYRENAPENVVISKRFLVYSEHININSGSSKIQNSINSNRQQIDFKLNYDKERTSYQIENLKVIIRKNGRWDQVVTGFKPTHINSSSGTLEYRLFKPSDQFDGLNEFRFFDMRSINFRGMNIERIDNTTTPTTVILNHDEPWSSKGYFDAQDVNGQYVIDHYEYGGGALEGDYIHTYFVLEAGFQYDYDIYIIGALTNWKIKDEFKMRYDQDAQNYYCRPLLKQGYYNYRYALKKEHSLDEKYVDGNHYRTENMYEIMVYYRPVGAWKDELIGYNRLVTK